jgi:hypothetical protein
MSISSRALLDWGILLFAGLLWLGWIRSRTRAARVSEVGVALFSSAAVVAPSLRVTGSDPVLVRWAAPLEVLLLVLGVALILFSFRSAKGRRASGNP